MECKVEQGKLRGHGWYSILSLYNKKQTKREENKEEKDTYAPPTPPQHEIAHGQTLVESLSLCDKSISRRSCLLLMYCSSCPSLQLSNWFRTTSPSCVANVVLPVLAAVLMYMMTEFRSVLADMEHQMLSDNLARVSSFVQTFDVLVALKHRLAHRVEF